jgi:hypothetical protein
VIGHPRRLPARESERSSLLIQRMKGNLIGSKGIAPMNDSRAARRLVW